MLNELQFCIISEKKTSKELHVLQSNMKFIVWLTMNGCVGPRRDESFRKAFVQQKSRYYISPSTGEQCNIWWWFINFSGFSWFIDDNLILFTVRKLTARRVTRYFKWYNILPLCNNIMLLLIIDTYYIQLGMKKKQFIHYCMRCWRMLQCY